MAPTAAPAPANRARTGDPNPRRPLRWNTGAHSFVRISGGQAVHISDRGKPMDAATRDLWTQRALALVLLADEHPDALPVAARALFHDLSDERDFAVLGEAFGRVTATLLGVATHL